MEAIDATAAPGRLARGELAARVTVQLSLLLAAATGCWLIAQSDRQVGAAAVATIIGFAVLGRWRPGVATGAFLFFAYISTGVFLSFNPAYIPLWIAAFAGVTFSLSWSAWQSPAAWRWAIMLWHVGIALSWPIIFIRESDFGRQLPIGVLPMVVFTAVSALCSGLWLDTLLTWDRHLIARRIGGPLLASAALSAAAAIYQEWVDITWLSGEPWTTLRRAVGLMGDANPMAIALALWAPLAPLVIEGRWRWPVGLALTAFLWYGAWLTGARSVLLLIPSGAVGLVVAFAAARGSRRSLAIAAAALIVCVAVGAVLVAQAPAFGPIARLTRSLPIDRPGPLLYEVLWRRDGYGLAAVRAIREHPLNGVGNATFRYLAPLYYRLDGGPLVPQDNAQNLWRQALAERGMLAFPALVAFTVLVAQLLFRRSTAPAWYATVLKAMTVGIGLALTFGLPTQDPATSFAFVAIIAWLYASVDHGRERVTLSRSMIAAVWVLALAGAALDIWTARTELRPPIRAARVGDPYVYGFGDLEDGPRGRRGRVVTDRAVVSLKPMGPRYNLQCWTRGSQPQQLRIWLNQQLVFDEAVPASVIIERLLDAPSDGRGMLLEFETTAPGVVVTGDFVN